jgi:hypothetical protein
VLDKTLLIEWLANNYKEYGTNLEIITDRSQEGAQFCRGFGGIGGGFHASAAKEKGGPTRRRGDPLTPLAPSPSRTQASCATGSIFWL